MESYREQPRMEMLYVRRERLLRKMYEAFFALCELEKNLANIDGLTESGKKEMEQSCECYKTELHAAWSELEYLDKEDKE